MMKVIKMSSGCYQKNKERHPKEARERHQNLSEEDQKKCEKCLVKNIKIFHKKKEKKRQYRRKRHKNLYKIKIKGQHNVEEIII